MVSNFSRLSLISIRAIACFNYCWCYYSISIKRSGLPPTFVKGFHDEASVRKMTYNRLGKTGLLLSQLSIGGAALAPFYEHKDEDEAIRAIQYAIKSGVNYIDTAPYYGQGRSEKIIGKALKGVPRQAYYIATKVGRYNMGNTIDEIFDFSAKKTKESIDISLNYLGLESVDVLQIHDIDFADSLDVVINETLPVIEEAKKQGKTRFLGVTSYSLHLLKEIILKAPGRFDTVLSYSRYTMLDNALLNYLPFFLEKDLGVICAACHALGLLTNHGPFAWHFAYDDLKKVGRLCGEYCKSQGVELGKLAIWYSAQLKGPATFLVGMSTTEIININLDSMQNGLTAKEKEILDYCLKNFCVKKLNWEGNEISGYRAAAAKK
ncbi:L-galactose dehydrogenase-like [Contarinia nasturtii]|uniref:L-galactose dehydrogenase-like n=1 Tax=Contarinia nasturtii TaxID=265458 RepID=UPI0012D472D8|nr:L-galactose dehydrogenase-like [Contarinia nasturtii]